MCMNHTFFEDMRPIKRKSDWRIMAEMLGALFILGVFAVISGYLIG